MLSVSKKTRAGRLTIASYLALALFVVCSVVAGLFSASLLSDGGAGFVDGLINCTTGGSILGTIIFYVLVAICVCFTIVAIVKAKKSGRKGIVRHLFEFVLMMLVILFLFVLVASYKKPIAEYVVGLFEGAAASVLALIQALAFVLAIIFFSIYLICQILTFVEILQSTKDDESAYLDGDPNTLTEEDMRQIIREELARYYGSKKEEPKEEPEEEKQSEEKPEEEPKEEEKAEEPVVEEGAQEEPVVEEPVVEDAVIDAPVEEKSEIMKQLDVLHLRPEDLDGNGRVSFCERLLVVDEELLEIYNTLKNKLLSYGLNSRLSASGDTFRLHRQTFAKITVSGKKIKIYLALDPKDFQDSTIPFVDVGHKKSFEQIPFAFKVKSGLSIRRALELIEATMEKAGIVQVNEPETFDYAHELVDALKEIRDGGKAE